MSRLAKYQCEPFNHVTIQYNTLIMKMLQYVLLIVQARLNLDLFCDVHTLLALHILPFLKVVNHAFIKKIQGKVSSLVIFVENIKNYQAYFFMPYFDFITSCQHEHL
jgi:hypothetical protein